MVLGKSIQQYSSISKLMSDLEYHLVITTITIDVKHGSEEDTRISKYTRNGYVFETSSCLIALKAAYFAIVDPPPTLK